MHIKPCPHGHSMTKDCVECRRVRQTSYYKEKRGKWSGPYKANAFKRKYGHPYTIVAELWAKQKGLCAICHKPPTENNPLVFDHDHLSGLPRGLLHKTCNKALGHLGDCAEGLLKAYQYLFSFETERGY